jgi:hypothetical protein
MMYDSLHGKLNFLILTRIDDMTVVCELKSSEECMLEVSPFSYMQCFSDLKTCHTLWCSECDLAIF